MYLSRSFTASCRYPLFNPGTRLIAFCLPVVLIAVLTTACGGGSSSTSGSLSSTSSNTTTDDPVDITDSEFSKRSGDCADYVDSYFSNVIDAQSSAAFVGDLAISVSSGDCIFQTNAIPNHDFNVNGSFATPVSAQSATYRVTTSPAFAASNTDLELGESAIFLNGVKLDLLPAACFDVGTEPLGQEKIGCGQDQIENPWRYDPMSPLNDFGTDDNNAHTQPDGTYHYHGNPLAMFDAQCESNMSVSPVIGFAADGFPIYGPCFDDSGTIRKATSSYVLKSGARQDVTGYTTPTVTGNVQHSYYDGQFRGDWEYSTGSGDLDECNGMTVDGQYGYYVTDTFPWVMNCLKGTKHSNFN